MSTPLRSEGWSVQPSFVPHGAVAPVTLLADENALTQLAGDPSVAWQTPWSELSNIQIVRFTRSMALFATTGGVRYCWRNPSRVDFEALRTIVVAHGGVVARHRRRAGVYSVAIVVLIAALAGGIGSWLFRNSSSSSELTDARHVNLTLKDLPTGWFSASTSEATPLSDLFPAPGKVEKLATKPAKKTKLNATLTKIFGDFATCLGVSAQRDRVYGAAGQLPDYQVTSQIFASTTYGGIEVLSTSQYYHTSTMVHRDTVEMSRQNFGSCFVTSNVALDRAINDAALPTSNVGVSFRPVTFLKGWSRGGEAVLSLPNVSGTPHLVMVEITSGHYEATLGVLVNKWPASQTFVSSLTSTMLSRMVSTTSKAD
jgi:hypothetical protein